MLRGRNGYMTTCSTSQTDVTSDVHANYTLTIEQLATNARTTEQLSVYYPIENSY